MLASELEGDSSRSPISMGTTHFEDHRLYVRRHLVRAVCRPERTVAKALQAVTFVARQPAVHGLPADAPLARDLAHCPTVGYYSKNRLYLCSVTLISLMAGECRVGTEVAVANLPKVCRAAAEGVLSPSCRTYTT